MNMHCSDPLANDPSNIVPTLQTELWELNAFIGGSIAQWQSACPRTKKSAVQASATAPCYGGELFIYIYPLLLILAPRQIESAMRSRNNKKQTLARV